MEKVEGIDLKKLVRECEIQFEAEKFEREIQKAYAEDLKINICHYIDIKDWKIKTQWPKYRSIYEF